METSNLNRLAILAALGSLFFAGCLPRPIARLEAVAIEKPDTPPRLAEREELQRVVVTEYGDVLPTEILMPLRRGDVITTDDHTTAIVRFLPEGEAIIFPGSRVEILNPSLFAWFGYFYLRGPILTHFDYGTADPAGTEYTVQAVAGGPVSVTVLHGAVRILPKGDGEALHLVRGERVTMAQGVARPRERVAREELAGVRQRVDALERLAARRPAAEAPPVGPPDDVGANDPNGNGGRNVLVPNVLHERVADARSALERLGLVVVLSREVPSEREPFYEVMRQRPDAGSSVQPGSRVVLEVAEIIE